MGVDDAEGCFLLAKMDERKDQQRVFDDIGEIAGMEGVAIIHRRQTDELAAFVKFAGAPDV